MLHIFGVMVALYCIIQNTKGDNDDAAVSRCTVNGDPHFYFFENSGHHYQGLPTEDENGWYYVVPCKPITWERGDDALPVANRFDYTYNGGNGNGGLPFSIIGQHTECGNERSCIKQVRVNMYNDVGVLYHSIYFNEDGDHRYRDVIADPATDEEFLPLASDAAYPLEVDTSVDGNPFLSIEYDTVTTTLTATLTNPADGCENTLFKVKFNSGTRPSVNIDVTKTDTYASPNDGEGGYVYQVCGLCGSEDGSFGQFNQTQTDGNGERRRGLLQELTGTPYFRAQYLIEDALGAATIMFLEDDDMINVRRMSNNPDVWTLTMTYGDSWIVEEEITTNTSKLYFPSDECITAGTDICTTFFQDEDSSTCGKCEGDNAIQNENTQLFIGFERWLQGCIYDTCSEAIIGGMALESLTYEEALAYGFLTIAGSTCDGLCDGNFGQCPSACSDDDGNLIECECSDDSNCLSCQSHGHCSQCESGYFMASQDNHYCYPCQEYAGEGCMFCQNQIGCGQCAQGYTRVQDDSCGENGNNLWYCV